MDLHTATPREIDTALAKLHHQYDRAGKRYAMYEKRLRNSAEPETAKEEMRTDMQRMAMERGRLLEEMAPLDAQYDRRGGWNRLYVVVGGHVHASTTCRNGYYFSTEWAWMPEWSGTPREEIVAAAGQRACSWCYPDAPRTPSVIEHPTETERRQNREKREADRAAKDAAAKAKQVLDPDTGQPIRHDGRVLNTERTVQIEAVAQLAWANLCRIWLADAESQGDQDRIHRMNRNITEHVTEAKRLIRALAIKRERDETELLAELSAKADKKTAKGTR